MEPRLKSPEDTPPVENKVIPVKDITFKDVMTQNIVRAAYTDEQGYAIVNLKYND